MALTDRTIEITVTVSPQMHSLLQGLLQTGFYGNSVEETTSRVLCEALIRIKKERLVESLKQREKEKEDD